MPKPTKIEKLETFLWDRWLLLKIHCEDGTVGIGEGGVPGWQRPTKTMIEIDDIVNTRAVSRRVSFGCGGGDA